MGPLDFLFEGYDPRARRKTAQDVMVDALRGQQRYPPGPPPSAPPLLNPEDYYSPIPNIPAPQAPVGRPQAGPGAPALPRAMGSQPQGPAAAPGPVPGGPAPVDPAQARLNSLQAQMEGLGGIDRSGMEASFKRNQEQGGQGLLLALAAQEAGNQPVASHYLQKARAAGEPIKTAGGTMTEGGFIEDVDYARQREEAKLQGQIAQQQAIINSNATREEKQRAEKSMQDFQLRLQRENNAAAMGRAQVAASGAAGGAVGGLPKKDVAKLRLDTSESIAQNLKALRELENAARFIPQSTSSGIGSAMDKAGDFLGVRSNTGKDAQAQLDRIAGYLTSTVPRMQGPQSNFDVELYKQMAGALNAATDPQRRLELVNEMRNMHMAEITAQKRRMQEFGLDQPGAAPTGGGSVADRAGSYMGN